MLKPFLALSLGCTGLFLTAPAGHSAPQCAARAEVLDQLSSKYGEARQAMGLAANATVMELHANAQDGSWTITITRADGVTCLMASGQGFETLAEPTPAKGAPA